MIFSLFIQFLKQNILNGIIGIWVSCLFFVYYLGSYQQRFPNIFHYVLPSIPSSQVFYYSVFIIFSPLLIVSVFIRFFLSLSRFESLVMKRVVARRLQNKELFGMVELMSGEFYEGVVY